MRPFVSLFSRLLLSLLAFLALSPGVLAMQFKVSQIGYHPQGPKIAYLEDVPEDVSKLKIILFDPKWTDRFQIFNGREVFKVTNIQPVSNEEAFGPGNTYVLDFSEFSTTGSYELRVEGHEEVKSQPVEITDYAYWDQLKPVIKTFYYQRNGQRLRDARRNFYFYDCMTDDGIDVEDSTSMHTSSWDAGGGWYDDGRFSKSVTSNALATARLMALYDSNPKSFQYFKLDYPFDEEGNGTVPDLMLEMKNSLNWLMMMQRRNGAVFSGVTGNDLSCDARENFDLLDRHVLDVSTKDTAAAAASLAMAGRTFREKDLGYAVKSLRAAEQAWDYLAVIPANNQDLPFRLWAAVELYITTDNPKYHQYFLKNVKTSAVGLYSVDNPMFQVAMDYLTRVKDPNTKIVSAWRNSILDQASQIMDQVQALPLQGGLGEFREQSNYRLVENINLLLAAYQLTQAQSPRSAEAYRRSASRAISYLYGLNPLGKTFITGIGTSFVRNIQMQRFKAPEILPGYLVSGPNENASDGVTPKGMGPLSFIDNPRATSVTQTHLLYNAGLAYALGMLNASYNLKSFQAEEETKKKPKFGVESLPKLPGMGK